MSVDDMYVKAKRAELDLIHGSARNFYNGLTRYRRSYPFGRELVSTRVVNMGVGDVITLTCGVCGGVIAMLNTCRPSNIPAEERRKLFNEQKDKDIEEHLFIHYLRGDAYDYVP